MLLLKNKEIIYGKGMAVNSPGRKTIFNFLKPLINFPILPPIVKEKHLRSFDRRVIRTLS